MSHVIELENFAGYVSEDLLATAAVRDGKRNKRMRVMFYPMDNSFQYVVDVLPGSPSPTHRPKKFKDLSEATNAYNQIP